MLKVIVSKFSVNFASISAISNLKRYNFHALFKERHKWIWLWSVQVVQYLSKGVINYRLASSLYCQSLIQLYLAISFIATYCVVTHQHERVKCFRKVWWLKHRHKELSLYRTVRIFLYFLFNTTKIYRKRFSWRKKVNKTWTWG